MVIDLLLLLANVSWQFGLAVVVAFGAMKLLRARATARYIV